MGSQSSRRNRTDHRNEGDDLAYQGFRIIDMHAHFPVRGGYRAPRERPQAIVDYGRRRDRRMRQEWDFPDPEPYADTPEEIERAAGRWVADLDRHGIDRINFLTGRDNETLAEVVRRHPDRLSGFCHQRPEDPESVDKLRRGIELGLRGYKILGPTVDRPFDDPAFRPLWTLLAEKRLPVLIHFGWLGHAGGTVYHPNMSPLRIEPVAREFLDIPFVIPHFGCAYIQDLLGLCWSLPNVYVDTSGSNQWMRWMPYPLTIEDAFKKFHELIGPERIVFGTDSSWFPRGFSIRYLQDQLRACRYLNLPEEDIALIFGGNAARLLHL